MVQSLNFMNNLSFESIDDLVNQGVTMKYSHLQNSWGLWIPQILQIKISPGHRRRRENRLILHEWLHAYEDLILYPHPDYKVVTASRSPDPVIDKYAIWYQKHHSDLIEYIRELFRQEGF